MKRKNFKAFHRGMGAATQGPFRVMEDSDDSLSKSSLQPRAQVVLLIKVFTTRRSSCKAEMRGRIIYLVK